MSVSSAVLCSASTRGMLGAMASITPLRSCIPRDASKAAPKVIPKPLSIGSPLRGLYSLPYRDRTGDQYLSIGYLIPDLREASRGCLAMIYCLAMPQLLGEIFLDHLLAHDLPRDNAKDYCYICLLGGLITQVHFPLLFCQ